jgi:hypothetical protein
VPKDLKPGKTETYTIKVTYDTLDLYGKLEATRTIDVAAQ